MEQTAEAVQKSGYFGEASTYVLPSLHSEIDRVYESGRLMALDARAVVGVTQHLQRSRSSLDLERKKRSSSLFAKELKHSFTSFDRVVEKHEAEVTSAGVTSGRSQNSDVSCRAEIASVRREKTAEASDVTQVRKMLRQRRKCSPLVKIRSALRLKAMNKKMAEARGAPAVELTSLEHLRQANKSLHERVSPMFALAVRNRHLNRRLSAVSERQEISSPSAVASARLSPAKRLKKPGSASMTSAQISKDIRNVMTPPVIHRKLLMSGVRRRQTMANLKEVRAEGPCSVRFRRFGEVYCFFWRMVALVF